MLFAASASTGGGGRRVRRDITEVIEDEKGPGRGWGGSGAEAAVFVAPPTAANLAPLTVNVPTAVEMELAGYDYLSRS